MSAVAARRSSWLLSNRPFMARYRCSQSSFLGWSPVLGAAGVTSGVTGSGSPPSAGGAAGSWVGSWVWSWVGAAGVCSAISSLARSIWAAMLGGRRKPVSLRVVVVASLVVVVT